MKQAIIKIAIMVGIISLSACTGFNQTSCGPESAFAYAVNTHCESTCNTCVSHCETCGYNSSFSDWY